MSKKLLIVSLFFLSVIKLSAQCTPDNSITKAGFYPNTLPDAQVGTVYNQTIQFKVLKDTTVFIFGSPNLAIVDSANITKVNGMPDGLTFKLNKVSKTYTPAEVGCALISGTPTKGGLFKLQIILKLYAKVSGFGVSQIDTIENFSIFVKGTGAINVPIFTSNVIFPNPLVTEKLFINPNIIKPGTIISIFNCQGQLLSSSIFESNQPVLFHFPKGLYYLNLDNGDMVSRVKLVKE